MSSNNQLCNNHFRVEWGGNRLGFMEVSGLASINLNREAIYAA